MSQGRIRACPSVYLLQTACPNIAHDEGFGIYVYTVWLKFTQITFDSEIGQCVLMVEFGFEFLLTLPSTGTRLQQSISVETIVGLV